MTVKSLAIDAASSYQLWAGECANEIVQFSRLSPRAGGKAEFQPLSLGNFENFFKIIETALRQYALTGKLEDRISITEGPSSSTKTVMEIFRTILDNTPSKGFQHFLINLKKECIQTENPRSITERADREMKGKVVQFGNKITLLVRDIFEETSLK